MQVGKWEWLLYLAGASRRALEMKLWIRGWGPDCEVLAPEWLREEIAEEMRRAAGVYEV